VMFQIASAAVFVLAFSELVETAWAKVRMRIRRMQMRTGHEALLLCPALLDFDEAPVATVGFGEHEGAGIEIDTANFDAECARPAVVIDTAELNDTISALETDEFLARLDTDVLEKQVRTDIAQSARAQLNGLRLLASLLVDTKPHSMAPVAQVASYFQPFGFSDDELAARPLLHTKSTVVTSTHDDNDELEPPLLSSDVLL
jgi:hypothetical protein